MRDYISKAIDIVKSFGRKVGLSAVVAGFASGFFDNGLPQVLQQNHQAKAGTVDIANYTTNLDVDVSELSLRNVAGATENYDAAYDSSFLSSPYETALEIYSNVWDSVTQTYIKSSTNSHPVKTKGWDFLLGVKGTATCDNYLRYKLSYSDFPDPIQINIYDKLTPNDNTYLTKDGIYHSLYLPDLEDETRNPYAQWRADFDYIVNPGETRTLGDIVASEVVLGAYSNVSVTGSIDANNVNLDENSSLYTTSVSSDTLTIGPGSTLTIAAIPGGPQGNTMDPVPEPSTIVLLSAAFFLTIYTWTRKRKS
jgi:hypothetical protein